MFLCLKGEGERLSHAVGCAFSACVEAKKQRDALCSVQANFHNKNKSVFEKVGTFRDPKNSKLSSEPSGSESSFSTDATPTPSSSKSTAKQANNRRVFGVVKNPIPEEEEWAPGQDENDGERSTDLKTASQVQPESAIERIHVPLCVLERMLSMKEFSKLNSKHDLPFSDRSKRQNRTMNMKYSVSASEKLFNPETTASQTSKPLKPLDTNSAIEEATSSINTNTHVAANMQSQFADNFDDSFTQSSTNYSNSISTKTTAADFNIPSSFSVPSFTNIPAPTPPSHSNAISGHRPSPVSPNQNSFDASMDATRHSPFSSHHDVSLTSVNNPDLNRQQQTDSAVLASQPKLSSTNPFYNFVSSSNQENSMNNNCNSQQILSSSHITNVSSSSSGLPSSNSQVTLDWSKAAAIQVTTTTSSYSVTNPFNNQIVH